MEILIVILFAFFLIAVYFSIFFYRRSQYWEQIADVEHSEKEYYSKESLDRMEEIFVLRTSIQELKDELKKYNR